MPIHGGCSSARLEHLTVAYSIGFTKRSFCDILLLWRRRNVLFVQKKYSSRNLIFEEDGGNIARRNVNTRLKEMVVGLGVIIVERGFIELQKISEGRRAENFSAQSHAIVHGRTKTDAVEKTRQIG